VDHHLLRTRMRILRTGMVPSHARKKRVFSRHRRTPPTNTSVRRAVSSPPTKLTPSPPPPAPLHHDRAFRVCTWYRRKRSSRVRWWPGRLACPCRASTRQVHPFILGYQAVSCGRNLHTQQLAAGGLFHFFRAVERAIRLHVARRQPWCLVFFRAALINGSAQLDP